MSFDTPHAFLLLLFIPLFIDRELFKIKSAVSLSSAAINPALGTSLKVKCRPYITTFLGIAGWCLLTLALARPQTSTEITPTEFSGKDIMMVLDISDSMKALDFIMDGNRIDRLTALKSVVSTFVEERKTDRLGLVVFGKYAFTMSPLTIDWTTVKRFVDDLTIGMADPRGTAIGEALAVALKRMNFESNSKVLVLVTDGTNNSGSISPLEAAQVAAKRGVRVHTIAVGTGGEVPIPVKTRFGTRRIIRQNLPIDEKTLKEISEITGGIFFNAKSFEKLKLVYDEIDKLEGRASEVDSFKVFEEHYVKALEVSLALFFLYFLLTTTSFFRIP